MKRLSWIGVVALMAGTTLGPTAAFADQSELYAAADFQWLGTVDTPAVTAPITVDVITYVPGSGEAVGGGQGSIIGMGSGGDGSLGTVETLAVTAPITVDVITYIPGDGTRADEWAGGGAAVGGGMGELPFFGTVETAAVTGPITVGGITYIPDA